MSISGSVSLGTAKALRWLSTLIVLLFFCHTSVFAGQVTLSWDSSPSANIGGYYLYYGQYSGNYSSTVDVGNQTTYTQSGLKDGKTYFFAVTAYDTTRTVESDFSNEVSQAIPTSPVLDADFSANPTSGTAPLVVNFTDTSTGATGGISNRSWDFGDSSTGSSAMVAKTYSNPGTYTVALTVMDSVGNSDAAIKTDLITVTVAPPPPPIADFSANPTSGTTPLTVNFTDSSAGDITSWVWDFGDGNSSTSQNPTHNYTVAGTYTVKLTAKGPGGSDSWTESNYITVSPSNPPPPQAGLVAAYGFEEESGAQVTDASSTANHGTISGATRTAQGWFGKALSFDGNNDWVTIDDHPSLDLSNGMTLEAWVYPTEWMSGWRNIIMKEQAGNVIYYLHANSDSDQPTTGAFIGTERILRGGSSLQPNQWTHLASTYDGTMQRLYVNGNEIASRSQSGVIQSSDGKLRLGGNNVWGEFFRGYIDEVRVYNRALAANEIQADMSTPVVDDNPPEPALLEVGEVEVNHEWQRVTFRQSFVDPVVVAKPLSSNDIEPAVIRIRNVDAAGFDIQVQEWDYLDGIHDIETVGYLVMEHGSHTLEDGTMVEAGRFEANAKSYTTVTFDQEFQTTPVVLAAATSFNESDAVATRIRNINTVGFQSRMREQEANSRVHLTETMSYIAWEVSSGIVDNVAFEVNRTGNVVTHNAYTISFQELFTEIPIFLADMQTRDGGDTANLRWDNKELFSVDVKVAEEQSKNSEMNHTTEAVGYMLFSPIP